MCIDRTGAKLLLGGASPMRVLLKICVIGLGATALAVVVALTWLFFYSWGLPDAVAFAQFLVAWIFLMLQLIMTKWVGSPYILTYIATPNIVRAYGAGTSPEQARTHLGNIL